MLWSTTHGQLLYEAGDFESYGIHSFLQLHSTYIALPFSLLYAALPTAATLFAIQSAAFAASIFPLYFIARKVITNRPLILSLIGVYLISFAVVSGLFYDFHWEAFVPVEFLSLFYLVERRRYAWSFVPAALGVLTLEVFPFLIVGLVLFGLYERIDKLGLWWRELVRDRDVRILTGLLVFAMASYAMIRFMQYWGIPYILGQPATASGIQNSVAPFNVTASIATLSPSVIYWLLLLATFGMLPLLAPRFLILSLPWIIDSVFLFPSFSDRFGDQYAMIAIAPLAIAAVQGLAWVARQGSATRAGSLTSGLLLSSSVALLILAGVDSGSRELLSGVLGPVAWILLLLPLFGLLLIVPWHRTTDGDAASRDRVFSPSPISKRVRRVLRQLPYGLLASVAIFSIVMSPINPTNYNATQYPGYYGFEWTENPVAGQMNWVLGHMSRDSIVLASDNLFPFVANNPNAYSALWFPYSPGDIPFLPFSANKTPQFVLTDSSQIGLLPAYLQHDLWNSSAYGLAAFIYYVPYPGSIYLFERDYAGQIGERLLTPTPANYYFTGTNLSIGASGEVASNASTKFGVAIDSRQAENPSGTGNCIWYGPYASFLPGNYSVTINVTGDRANLTDPANTPVLLINAGTDSANLPYFYWVVVTATTLESSRWVNLQFNVSLREPYPLVEFRGYLVYTNGVANGFVVLNYEEVSRQS